MKLRTSDEPFWAMQNAEVEKLIQDFPLLLANDQNEVDPSLWERNGHAIRMRVERTLEAMAAEGDGSFEWRRRGRGKGHRVFVFNPLGKKRAELRGMEHEYFLQHHIRGVTRPPTPAPTSETRDRRRLIPEDACKHLLIFSVLIARWLGSYVWPAFFFELPRTLYPDKFKQLRLDTLKIEQIERTFDQLLLKGYMRQYGTTIVRNQEITLLYPTRVGFKIVDSHLRRMKRYYPLNGVNESR